MADGLRGWGIETNPSLHQNQKNMYYKHTIRTRSMTAFEREYLEWYHRKVSNPGLPFDPLDLVKITRQQHPHKPEWAEAFARCTRQWPESELYTHFMSWAEQQRSWAFACGFVLEHVTHGTLIIDVLKDGRIGGVEYLTRVLNRSAEAARILRVKTPLASGSEWKARPVRSKPLNATVRSSARNAGNTNKINDPCV